jgi:molybdate transport system substrate-binding protein
VRRLVSVGVAAALAACSTPAASREEIVLFAAASLTESFREIGAAFEAAEGVRVRLAFGPSGGLATQIAEGAPADAFASASERWMNSVARRPGVGRRAIFARNRLVVILPTRNRAGIHALADLARPGLKLVLAAPGVPAGAYAREALERAGLLAAVARNLVSNEEDVKGVVQKVLLDEADGGIAYATDVTPTVAAAVRVLTIPEAVNVIVAYPIAVVSGSRRTRDASRFVDFVLGPGQDVLRRFGFLPP